MHSLLLTLMTEQILPDPPSYNRLLLNLWRLRGGAYGADFLKLMAELAKQPGQWRRFLYGIFNWNEVNSAFAISCLLHAFAGKTHSHCSFESRCCGEESVAHVASAEILRMLWLSKSSDPMSAEAESLIYGTLEDLLCNSDSFEAMLLAVGLRQCPLERIHDFGFDLAALVHERVGARLGVEVDSKSTIRFWTLFCFRLAGNSCKEVPDDMVSLVMSSLTNTEIPNIPEKAESPRREEFKNPALFVGSLLGIIRGTIASLWLKSEDWGLREAQPDLDVTGLQRCPRFMEPSVFVLMARRRLLAEDNGLGPIETRQDMFDLKIDKIELVTMNVNRAFTLIKRVDSEGAPLRLQVCLKDVNLLLKHPFEMLWKQAPLSQKYLGVNEVLVIGMKLTVTMDVFADERGLQAVKTELSLGHVEHTCTFSNAGLISEIIAHAALDWFREPVSNAIEDAAMHALNDWLKSRTETINETYWKSTLSALTPDVMLEILGICDKHFPSHGCHF